jgi:hypothetical protein
MCVPMASPACLGTKPNGVKITRSGDADSSSATSNHSRHSPINSPRLPPVRLAEVHVHESPVDVGVRDAEGIIAWRLGTPMYAPVRAGLDDERRADVLGALRAAVKPESLVPPLLVLSTRVHR